MRGDCQHSHRAKRRRDAPALAAARLVFPRYRWDTLGALYSMTKGIAAERALCAVLVALSATTAMSFPDDAPIWSHCSAIEELA
jgi:hypothetical protein